MRERKGTQGVEQKGETKKSQREAGKGMNGGETKVGGKKRNEKGKGLRKETLGYGKQGEARRGNERKLKTA